MRIPRLWLSVILLAAVTTACAANAAPRPRNQPTPKPLSALQVCQKLRADILTNGGLPDKPTVAYLLDQEPPNVGGTANGGGLFDDLNQLNTDMQSANPNQDVLGLDVAAISGDCGRAEEVDVPYPS